MLDNFSEWSVIVGSTGIPLVLLTAFYSTSELLCMQEWVTVSTEGHSLLKNGAWSLFGNLQYHRDLDWWPAFSEIPYNFKFLEIQLILHWHMKDYPASFLIKDPKLQNSEGNCLWVWHHCQVGRWWLQSRTHRVQIFVLFLMLCRFLQTLLWNSLLNPESWSYHIWSMVCKWAIFSLQMGNCQVPFLILEQHAPRISGRLFKNPTCNLQLTWIISLWKSVWVVTKIRLDL